MQSLRALQSGSLYLKNIYKSKIRARTAFHMKRMYKEALEEWKAFYAARDDREAEEALARGYLEDGYSGAMLFVAETMEKRSRTTYVTPWQIGTFYRRAG